MTGDGPIREREIDATFRMLADNLPELAWSARPDGYIDYYNQRWYEYTGTTFEQMEGWGWEKVHHPEMLRSVVERWEGSLQSGEPFEMEFPLRGADGKFRWFLTRVRPLRDGDGRIVRWFGSNTDIDDLKQLREAQAESEERYFAIFEKSPFAIALSRMPDATLVAVNDAFLELFEYEREHVLGKTSVDLGIADADSRARVAEEFREHDVVRNFEVVRHTRSGKRCVLSLNLARVRVGLAAHVLTTIEDVTERRATADAIRLLAEASSVFGTSLAYDETLARVATFSIPRFADTCTVYLRQDDGSVTQVVAAGEQAEVLRAVHRTGPLPPDAAFGYPKVIRTGKPELVERVTPSLLRAIALTEEQVTLMESAGATSYLGVPLEERGAVIGAVFFSRTSSEKRYSAKDLPLALELGRRASIALENARLFQQVTATVAAEKDARRRAEDATRLKDEFLATLSHELRTPLNAILGWATLLQSERVAPEKRAHALETIVRNAVAQSRLVDELLDLNRVVSGKLRLSIDTLNVVTVVEAAIDVVQLAADAKAIQITRALPSVPLLVSGDAGRLQQVVWNLLSNAVKFTLRGGRVHVMLASADASMLLVVSDTGIGVEPDFLPHVFDRFRQQDGSVTRQAGGLGLGLSIVKSIVELHGGTVEASSAGTGRGATFVVRIPLAQPATPSLDAARTFGAGHADGSVGVARPSEIEGLRVLVVDDEPDARELTRALLESRGARVREASSAAEARASIRVEEPDLIVTDIGMPEEDGYRFIERLRAEERGAAKIPAIALTAYAGPEDAERALAHGFQAHARKPIEVEEFLAAIHRLTKRLTTLRTTG